MRKLFIALLLSIAAVFPVATQAGSIGGALGGMGQALEEIMDRRLKEEQEKELIRYKHEMEMQSEARREARRVEAEKRQREAENKQREFENKQREAGKQKAERDRREKEANEVSIGSGFFVTSDGYFVTNYHVIKNSKSVTLRTTDGRTIEAQIARSDVTNDLVLLKADGRFAALPVASSRTAKKGQAVATVGYPHANIQGVEPKVTEGIVSSISGISGDPRMFQISVPIQSGNSGGPLVTKEGNVIGIIVSKLSAAFMLKQTGDVTQNVNYAIKSNYLLELLDAANLEIKLVPVSKKSNRSLEDITAVVEKATALVVARPTQTASTVQFSPPPPSPSIATPSPPIAAPPAPSYSLEEMYARGSRALAAKQYSEAILWLSPAAERGHAGAQSNMGVIYSSGYGITKDDAEAVRWYRKAAEQGNVIAQTNLGSMFMSGRGTAKDDTEAVRWFRMAAEQGYSGAQNNLGAAYANGHGIAKDETEAVRWYRKAAEQGYAIAQANIGLKYANGHGVAKDDTEAVRWFRVAAEQGHAGAQSYLGVMYANGRGIAKDEAEAVRWYRKAAEQGHLIAQTNLGVMLMTGRGIAKDDAEAVRWNRMAADQGNAIGQANIGLMFENGRGGLPKDVDTAVAWYHKAAAQGQQFAITRLKALGR